MKKPSLRPWLGLVLGVVVGLWARPGVAQLAPTGGHYAARASDTGTSPGSVNASGGYSTAIPLELPASRRGLPVPLSIGSGTRGVGAVGLGWDIPLSYIRRDMTFAHRAPHYASGAPTGREQVTLFLQGRVLDLVPRQVSAGPPQELHWVARYDAPDLLVKEAVGAWVMYDGDGRAWTFTQPAVLSGTGLWLLTSIIGPDSTAVELTYDVSTVAVAGGAQGLTLDLRTVRYNKHPSDTCFKNELTLNYGAPAASPLTLSLLGDRVLTRTRTLSTLDVSSRATCASLPERLRTYAFAYGTDADTKQPLLVSVTMQGRQGTPEQSVPLPVASFTYGSATTAGKLTYAKTASIPMPTGADATKISSTGRDGTFLPPITEVGSATWQSLTDVTGDGLPDVVYNKSGKLWVAVNRPGSAGATTLGTVNAQLQDTTFASGPFETRSASEVRFPNSIATPVKDRVWRQALDVNGDGRVDVVDAAASPREWIIYLNTPGTGASGVTWVRRVYGVGSLYDQLVALGHPLSNGYLPLSSRFSGRGRSLRMCWKWNASISQWESQSGGANCGSVPVGTVASADPESTFTEWEVKDLNGDSFPDFVFNSSPVEALTAKPVTPGTLNGQIVYGDYRVDIGPRQGSATSVQAVFNFFGMFLDTFSPVFSSPVVLRANTACGVARWLADSDSQTVRCGLEDVNGDGLLDRVEDSTVWLGTGSGFSNATLTLPGSGFLSVQNNAQQVNCVWPNPAPPGTTPYPSGQNRGLRDLTGDGIPDYVVLDFNGQAAQWTVAVGTGAGFAPAVNIDVTGSTFSLSGQTERCDGQTSSTLSGLYDLNGDGKPEVVRVNGANLDVYQLSGGTRPGKPEAGRLIRVNNGYGALTTVAWRSAKEDGTTKHQVPFPEIVVSSVVTVGSQGLGGTLAETRYAYGGAELVYDSTLQAFTLPGYQRSVTLNTVTVGGKGEGYGTITDTYPLPAFDDTSKAARFRRYRLAGRVRDVTTVTSASLDPWTLLATDLTTYGRRLQATHYDWAAKVFEEPVPTGTTNSGLDCLELPYPYDFTASNALTTNRVELCRSHGFLYTSSTDTWRGSAAPPSTANVATRSEVTNVDDFGRVLNVKHANDVYRSDDDLCVETLYAAPTGGTGPVRKQLHAPMSRRAWYCDKTPFVTYASESWLYDGLASGSVSVGHATTHTRDRRDAAGAVLDTVTEYTAGYDAAGNATSLRRVREDGAVRTVRLGYEEFGLGLTEQRVEASGVPALFTTYQLDPLTLEARTLTETNQTLLGFDVDGYGRQVRTTVQPPGGPLGVMSTTGYLGFSGADPLGRRVVNKDFSDPVTPGTEASAAGHVQTTFLDELARPRRTEAPLGSDYGTEVMITGARTYDDLGRVVFEADPYPASQSAATAYGTTSFFELDGTVACSIRGNGPQAYTATPDAATERLPTCYSRAYVDHLEKVTIREAESLSTTAPQANVLRTATLTGAGRLLSRTTTKSGTALEHATFGFDRLGHLTTMTRYLDPVNLTGPVTWSWTYDSFGQRLTWQEPDSAPRTMTYSTWGEPLEVAWTEAVTAPTGPRSRVMQYDALSRVTHTEDRTNGVAEADTVHDCLYDTGVSPTSLVTPTNVRGRLARTKSSLGEVFYSYDAYGRPNAHVYTDAQGRYYVEQTVTRADGALDTLTRYLPDTGYKQETVWYAYDTAQRPTYIKFEDASTSQELYLAKSIDAFGRVRGAVRGGVVELVGDYANTGRRLPISSVLSSSYGSRALYHTSRDLMGREAVRTEVVDGASTGVKTTLTYDALGRLASSRAYQGAFRQSDWSYTYDALGNVLTQTDNVGTADAAMSYGSVDRDRLCRIGYGNGGLGGTACNVTHDSVGNVVRQPTRTGTRKLDYFPSGEMRGLTAPEGSATWRSGAMGTLRELDLRVTGREARHVWRFGDLLELKDQVIDGASAQVLTRHIPGPGGIIATRRGFKGDWVYAFEELRGARYAVDSKGRFIQDVDYAPFGDAKSSGAAGPGSLLYSSSQWNGGEALESLGLAHLGARLYDPVVGRFLSRDPLFVPRTAATTNPYGFAMNDPVNSADPSGMDPGCMGQECQGSQGAGFPGMPGGGGGASPINDPGLYFPSAGVSGGFADPEASVRSIASVASFTQVPGGAQTLPGRMMKLASEILTGVEMDPSFNYDVLAAKGFTLPDVVERIQNTPRGAAMATAIANAGIDRWSSYFQGLGDSVFFWCPGCTQNMRTSWGITSGGDPYYYLVGSLTGIVGSLFAPTPKGMQAASEADYQRLLYDRVRHVNAVGGRRNCFACVLAAYATLTGAPASALKTGGVMLGEVESYFGRSFVQMLGKGDVSKTVANWGEGTFGALATVNRAGEGHIILVQSHAGRAYFVDPQSVRLYPKFSGIKEWYLMQLP